MNSPAPDLHVKGWARSRFGKLPDTLTQGVVAVTSAALASAGVEPSGADAIDQGQCNAGLRPVTFGAPLHQDVLALQAAAARNVLGGAETMAQASAGLVSDHGTVHLDGGLPASPSGGLGSTKGLGRLCRSQPTRPRGGTAERHRRRAAALDRKRRSCAQHGRPGRRGLCQRPEGGLNS